MAISLSGSVTLDMVLTAVESLDVSAENRTAFSKAITQTWATGTSVGQMDRLFIDDGTIAATATNQYDLAGGGLVDVLKNTFGPARIKFLALINLGPNDIQLVRPTNGVPIYLASGDGEQIPVSGVLAKSWPSAAGVAVTAGTGDLLNVINTAVGTTLYQLIIGAASA